MENTNTHTEEYLQAKYVVENPTKYDPRDVSRAQIYCEAYLDGFKQGLMKTEAIFMKPLHDTDETKNHTN